MSMHALDCTLKVYYRCLKRNIQITTTTTGQKIQFKNGRIWYTSKVGKKKKQKESQKMIKKIK